MRHVHVLGLLLVGLSSCSSGEEKTPGAAGAGGGAGIGGAGSGGSGGSLTAGTGNVGGGGTGGVVSAGAAGAAGASAAAGVSASGAGAGVSGAGGSDGGSAGAGAAGSAGIGGAGAGNAGAPSGGAGNAGMAGGAGALTGTPTEDALEPLDTVRQEHGVSALDGEIYVVGGYTPQATDSVRAYDPTTMMWRDAPDFPGPLNHGNVASANGKLYVLGFFIGGDQTTASAQSYSFDGTSWVEVEPLPVDTQRAAACVAALGNAIYVFGGRHASRSVATASVYDAVDDSWTPLPDMPAPREHCVAGAIAGKIYIAGGRKDTIDGVEATTLEFDPENPGYVQKAPITTPRGGIAGAVLGEKLFVFGGEGNDDEQSGVFAEIESYDPATDTWEAYPPMDVPRHGMGAAEVGGRIYLPAGANRQGGAAVDDVSVFFFE
jgi:N-acetylneuraminic acid mutarotase